MYRPVKSIIIAEDGVHIEGESTILEPERVLVTVKGQTFTIDQILDSLSETHGLIWRTKN